MMVGMWSGWIGSLAAEAPIGGGVWPNSVSSARAWISTSDRRSTLVGRYFSTRLSSEDRSERGALVGVLVDRNGGRRKNLPT